jgi:hypothetical protein
MSNVNFNGYEVVTTGKQNSRKTEKNEEATLNPELISQWLNTRGHYFLTHCLHASSTVPLNMKQTIIKLKPTIYK